ncbi:MAB_1171c family putative transporter [Streptomyces phaeoluteigriseus]|uniref:MAB_1171c family putative transporter n=1 Tax=Streptomyces phaeoluteigriseus TaxID=114686 RepID=UPI000B8CC740|nr:MAB_1171c family putative transporter [Streptomyces phaeoluteigriseus]
MSDLAPAAARLTEPPALTPAGFVNEFYPSFWWIPAGILAAALAIKLPSIIRLWTDPLLRAVGGLLVLALSVFVFVAPSTIASVNRITGVPNISGPWVYSLLTAFCGSCLLLIITWRNGLSDRSPRTRSAMRWVLGTYAAVIVALWVLFALADMPEERLRDLDTYYANTPYAREMIVLYLLAHTVATLVTNALIWNWVRADGLDSLLRWGLKFLGVGYALQLAFDAAKLSAVGGRWAGRDLDWLSTAVAPPLACLSAILIAVGFILPHTGQYLHDRRQVRNAVRELRPLYQLMKTGSGGGVPRVLRATPELRLIRRETFIRDGLLSLSRFVDEDLRGRAYDAALALGHPPDRAKALAAAVTVLDAADARSHGRERDGDGGGSGSGSGSGEADTTDLLRDIGAVSRALRHPDAVRAVRERAGAAAADADAATATDADADADERVRAAGPVGREGVER